MPYSYNGWYASPTLPTRPLVIAGEPFTPGVLDNDDVHTVFEYLATQLHERVEPIVRSDWHQADDWGFYYRSTTGDPSTLSCHSSGTAIDYNATRHPYGVAASRNFSEEQIAEIRKICAFIGVVRWGGDYRGNPDAMHFEIIGNPDQVAAAARKIRALIERDEFDMADLNDLRNIVREEIRDPGFIAKIGDEVWRREFSATNAQGVSVKKAAREFLTTTWEAVKRLP